MGYEFKVGDEGKTRHGNPYRVLSVDARGRQPVISEVCVDGMWSIRIHNADGKYWPQGHDDFRDLMPPTRKVWANIYPASAIYDCREDADRCASEHRVACVEIEIPAGD